MVSGSRNQQQSADAPLDRKPTNRSPTPPPGTRTYSWGITDFARGHPSTMRHSTRSEPDLRSGPALITSPYSAASHRYSPSITLTVPVWPRRIDDASLCPCALSFLFPDSLGLVCLDSDLSPLLLPLRLLGLLVPPVPVAIVPGFCRLGACFSLHLLALDADERVGLAALGRLESALLGLLPLGCTTLNLVP